MIMTYDSGAPDVDESPASLFNEEQTPRERRFYCDAVKLLKEFGYDRWSGNKPNAKRVLFSGNREKWVAVHWENERDVWQIEPAISPDQAIRDCRLSEFFAEAQAINDSPALMAVYAAPGWDELGDDGKLWVCSLVRETLARSVERLLDS